MRRQTISSADLSEGAILSTDSKTRTGVSNDPFHPANVLKTTRSFAVCAVIAVIVTGWPDISALLAVPKDDPDATLAQGVLGLGAFAMALLIWMAAEVWLSQKRWAALIIFLVAALSAVLNVLVYLSEPSNYFFTMVGIAGAIAGFAALRGARQIAAGEFVVPPATADVDETPLAEASGPKATAVRVGTQLAGLLVRALLVGICVTGLVAGVLWWNHRNDLAPAAVPTAPDNVIPTSPVAIPPAPAADQQIIPASAFDQTLPDMYIPANPTPANVAAAAQALCTGQSEGPTPIDVIVEHADAEVELFTVATRYGYKMTPADLQCFNQSRELSREYYEEKALLDADQ